MVSTVGGWRLLVGGYTKDATGSLETAGLQPEPVVAAHLYAAGELSVQGLVDGGTNPSWIELHPRAPLAYGCSEDFGAGVEGVVTSWDLTADGAPLVSGRGRTGGHAPCHLAVVPDPTGGHCLVICHYVGGQVTVVPLDRSGNPEPTPSQVVTHRGASGAVPDRQAEAHPHQAVSDGETGLVWVADLGQDRLAAYHLNAGQLHSVTAIELPAGFGPRHSAIHPAGGWLALVGELSNQVLVYRRAAAPAYWAPVAVASTLPVGWDGSSAAAAIGWNTDGTRLYASNRGHDSVAVWAFDQSDSSLRALGHCPVGRAPRDVALSPDGRFMLVAAQGDHKVVVYPVDPTGRLGPPAAELACANPARVAVIRPD